MSCKDCNQGLPEGVFINDNDFDCQGEFTSTGCIVVNGVDGTEEYSSLNDLLYNYKQRLRVLEYKLQILEQKVDGEL